MKKNLLFLFVLSLLLITNSQAVEVEPYDYNNEKLLLPIPNGFCNATEELVGIFAMDYMNNQLSEGFDAISPVIVFTRCGFENDMDEIYPWGYIALDENSKPRLTQEDLNKMLDGLLDRSDMILTPSPKSPLLQELDKNNDNATKKAISEYDMEFDSFQTDQTMLHWTDENVAIFTTSTSYTLDGEKFSEVSVTASTVLNKVLINYMITDLKNELNTPIENSTLLIDNSKLLVRMNK